MFKFIYSCRLADMGLATQAFHYCEVIAKNILQQPHRHSPVLISQLLQVRPQEPVPDSGTGTALTRSQQLFGVLHVSIGVLLPSRAGTELSSASR